MYRFCKASPDLDGIKWVRNHAFENAIEKFWMQNSLKIVTSTESDCLAWDGIEFSVFPANVSEWMNTNFYSYDFVERHFQLYL